MLAIDAIGTVLPPANTTPEKLPEDPHRVAIDGHRLVGKATNLLNDDTGLELVKKIP